MSRAERSPPPPGIPMLLSEAVRMYAVSAEKGKLKFYEAPARFEISLSLFIYILVYGRICAQFSPEYRRADLEYIMQSPALYLFTQSAIWRSDSTIEY